MQGTNYRINKETIAANTQNHKLEYNDTFHLNELLREILAYYKEDGYDKFEEISMYIKKKMTKLSFQYKTPKYLPKACIEITQHEQKILKNLGKKKIKSIETVDNYMEDILSKAKLLEWGGISFGKNEWFKIRLATKKLLLETEAQNIRFWGKIYGLHSDYYIIQGYLKNFKISTNPTDYKEVKGTEGINKDIFWVSNSILEDWYELPDITAEQLTASRNFKYQLTGDLKAKVKSFNSFPGKESHLLKCQIIRITHGCNIVPEGYLRQDSKIEGDLADKFTEYNDEFQPLTLEDVRTEDRWVHEYGYIFPNGKIIDLTQETQIPRMQSISQDEPINEELKFWKFRVIGDQMQYNLTSGNGNVTYCAVLIKNMKWPGFNCIWKGNEFSNIYVGNGIKHGGNIFIPTQPEDVVNDPEGIEEYPEPNPDKEPEPPIESDSDEEKNEEDEQADD